MWDAATGRELRTLGGGGGGGEPLVGCASWVSSGALVYCDSDGTARWWSRGQSGAFHSAAAFFAG